MTKIETGGIYIARAVKSGENIHGPWELLVVAGEGPRQPKIGVSVLNPPSGVGISGAFRIERISSVAHRKWKDNNDVWHEGNVTVKAEVTPVAEFEIPKKKRRKREIPEFTNLEEWFN